MELLNETKFCVKCFHYRHKGKGHLCAANKLTKLDMVTGEYHEEGLVDCNTMRKAECGEEATRFKTKLTDIN